MIHVNRGATSLGTFSEEEVREGLRTGRFAPTDLGWRDGLANWQPLSQFTEFGGAEPAAPPPQISAASVAGPVEPRSGLPWDGRQTRGFFNAFVETLVMVLTKPDAAFRAMKIEGGLVEPLIYALIGGWLGGVVAFLFSLGFQSMGLFANRHNAFGMLTGMGLGSIAFIILLPVMIVIVLFIGAAIVHLCLMIVGGANKTFEATFRVLAFSQGSTGPLQMIPVCGGLIAGVWGLVVTCIGLARAHETETGRAVFAVFLPLVVCCGGAILMAILVPALIHMRSQ
ncbi:MAG TPA: YIP1 family protein [Candidatus Udaeobacter sp.]